MKKTIVFYALILVLAAFMLEWLEYRYLLRSVPLSGLIAVVAVAFIALGIWVGIGVSGASERGAFEVNDKALAALGVSDREYAVLKLLATGRSNKEIARELGISPNTVKTHVANLYAKLSVSKRTEAVYAARQLGLIA